MGAQRCPVCSSVAPATVRACPTCGAPLAADGGAAGRDQTGALPLGTKLNHGGFSVGRVLGRGGFGITYLGADLGLKRAVAIKEFFPAGSTRTGTSVILAGALSRADYELATQKFAQEAQMLARFRHRSIVNVYEVFQENDTVYMVMEYLQGENMLERMERRGGPLPEAELVTLTGPVAEALEEVHAAGVLHRDIKPENIMLVGHEHAPRPVLIDFGAAREFASGMVNRHSIVLTPGYAPLEQYGEQARRGPFTDVYALAGTLYHVSTGEQPPAATERALGVTLKPPRSLNPGLSPEFDSALMHGMEMKVDERPQTALGFYRELAGESPVAARAPVPAAPASASWDFAPAPATSPPAPPMPVPAPVPATSGSHMERVRQIAHELGAGRPIQTDRFLCPVCRAADMVDSALATAGIRCPVCRAASLEAVVSTTDPLLCPACSSGELQPMRNSLMQSASVMRCPACRTGAVRPYTRSQMLFVPDLWARCDNCGADFDYHTHDGSLTLAELPGGPGQLSSDWIGKTETREGWAAIAGEVADAYVCNVCASEFHACGGGGLEWVARGGDPVAVPREHQGRCWSRVLWAKLAHRVPADAGTTACPNCDAQFDESTPGQLTLLRASQDPFGTLAAHRGRTHAAATWRALATGNRSRSGPGLVCPSCTAELAETRSSDGYELVSYDRARDPHGVGQRYTGQRLGSGDWRRVAAGGVPAGEEQRLREEAHREFWAAMLAGEVLTSASDGQYPWRLAPGENVVTTFLATQFRSRFGFSYRHDSGQVWLTTWQLYYSGERGDISVPLREAAGCEVADTGPERDPVIEIVGRDGSDLFRFGMGRGTVEFVVDGLALQLRWDEGTFVELFESLRRQA